MCVVVHDRGIWKHVAYLGGKTARHIREVLRDSRKLESHQRFAPGPKYAAVWLKQKGFTGAIDVVEVGDKEDLSSEPNRPPGHHGDVRRRV